jgi:hypothetical protein
MMKKEIFTLISFLKSLEMGPFIKGSTILLRISKKERDYIFTFKVIFMEVLGKTTS